MTGRYVFRFSLLQRAALRDRSRRLSHAVGLFFTSYTISLILSGTTIAAFDFECRTSRPGITSHGTRLTKRSPPELVGFVTFAFPDGEINAIFPNKYGGEPLAFSFPSDALTLATAPTKPDNMQRRLSLDVVISLPFHTARVVGRNLDAYNIGNMMYLTDMILYVFTDRYDGTQDAYYASYNYLMWAPRVDVLVLPRRHGAPRTRSIFLDEIRNNSRRAS